MKVNRNENIVPIDVDQTLIMHDYWNYPHLPLITVNYYGLAQKTVAIHTEHVLLLKSYKKRGFFVRVWSNNGFRHAEEVVKKLDLVDWVDEVESKGNKFVDDLSADQVLGQKVYVKP